MSVATNPATASPVDALLAQLDQIIVGKSEQTRLALACLLARGHLLIEDLPGMGKTTLAHALAAATGLNFNRVQFTSDLLPADIIGVSIYQQEDHRFQFHPGPIFTNVVLADEINRATPKAQSALLEAMEERQVSVEGTSHELPKPFFVIATQNPRHLVGTFPLPESQLDRFLIRIEMGYPGRDAEREILKGEDRRDLYRNLKPVVDGKQLLALQDLVHQVHVSDALLEYVQDLLAASRGAAQFTNGLSPRAGLGLVQAARAWAFVHHRKMVLPEDIQSVALSVMVHRLHPTDSGQAAPELVQQLLDTVPIP
ncbi:MAG: AAA family ATPase [Acidithiobacillales bacterium SG8_45]|jgi:MoxR-like ATPase|nr:MAG: AAA family ATPase [Acidithiobacillales bacterium SG8_45]